MKPNLKDFPKAPMSIRRMTSADLLTHILRLVSWKSDFKLELEKLLEDFSPPNTEVSEAVVDLLKEILGV